MEDCVLAGGTSWNNNDVHNVNSSAKVSGIYYWTDGNFPFAWGIYSTPITYSDDLANPKTYKEFSIGDKGNHWIMSQYGDKTLPVPYKSRFM